ncbi:hypothetical protein RFI_25759 [Reticulomyxa filosa]|uniref:Uncharacterized protein n=1 Tax=Reticulomyxa filosa TaxID=46433 RepID=X6MDW6_RETFI|nr:hypothetical protein RFI_25759 [Reticulomyxa filosa]|eukprot:ETO11617.1 hypothetical protein RFI_25759 [Reticulomyxa filosa]
MQSKVKQEILEWISGSILTATSMVTDDNKDEPVQQFLAKMDNFMEDLKLVTTHIHTCFPHKYKIMSFYIDNYLKILTAPLMNLLDANMVKTQERLSIVAWIDRFKRKIEDLRSKRSLAVDDDEEDIRGPGGARPFERSKGGLTAITRKEVMVNDVPYTQMPQDLFTTLNHQFDTAQEKLKGHALVQVLQMILKCMDGFRQKLQQHVNEKLKNWSDRMCEFARRTMMHCFGYAMTNDYISKEWKGVYSASEEWQEYQNILNTFDEYLKKCSGSVVYEKV